MIGKNWLTMFLATVFIALIISGYISNRVVDTVQGRIEYQQAQIDSIRGDYATKVYCARTVMTTISVIHKNSLTTENFKNTMKNKAEIDKLRKEITEVIRDCKN